MYSCVYKTLNEEWGHVKSAWNLSFEVGVLEWERKYTSLSWCAMRVTELKGILALVQREWYFLWLFQQIRSLVNNLLSIPVDFTGCNSKDILLMLLFFFTVRSLQTSFHVFFYFLFLFFYSIAFIRSWNFHDHQVLWISMGFELLSHFKSLK